MKDYLKILKLFLFVPVSLICLNRVYAQERFYLRNGNAFPNHLVEADDKEIKVIETKGSSIIRRSYGRGDMLIAFNSHGMYIIIENLSANPTLSKTSLENFYNTSGLTTDILIKSTPVEVIPATIRMESEAVNYLTEDGRSASINKNDLVAIIYKNGTHVLLKEPEEAKELLKIAFKDTKKYFRKITVNETVPADSKLPVEEKAVEKPRPVLSEQEYTEYKQKSVSKVEQFSNYLQLIADKSYSLNDRDVAIQNALKLFLPDSKIEVSSKNRKSVTTLSLETYLKRLKMLPYGKVQIKWTNIEYVKELKMADDGSYYGTIVGSQRFTGSAGKSQQVSYSDVTKKSVKVKVKPEGNEVEGETKMSWAVLLGEIGVESDEL